MTLKPTTRAKVLFPKLRVGVYEIIDAEFVGGNTYKVVYVSEHHGSRFAVPGVLINGQMIETGNLDIARRRYADRVRARLLG